MKLSSLRSIRELNLNIGQLAEAILAAAEGGIMAILILDANPTTTATGSDRGRMGVYAASLYLHTTDAIDTNWVNLTALLSIASTYVPQTRTVAGKVLSSNVTLVAGDVGAVPSTQAGMVIAAAGDTPDVLYNRIHVTGVGLNETVDGTAPNRRVALSLTSDVVYSAGFDVSFSAFVAGGGAVGTVRLAPDLPTGAVIVGASAHNVTMWQAPSLATLTVEFDDQSGGTASVIRAFDGTDPTAGATDGRMHVSRAISYPTCTVRITGDTLDHLTNGSAHLEVFYRVV
jgi:hypothetical protein